MTNEYVNQFTENMKKLTQNAFCPVSDLQKVTTETFEHYTRKNMELMTSAFESTTKRMQSLAEIKKAEDFAKFCSDCAQEASEQAMTLTKEAFDESLEVSKKYAEAFKKSVKDTVAA